VVTSPGPSRRALLAGAPASLAGAFALAGCGRKAKSGRQSVKRVARPIRQADVEILGEMLDLERHTVAAYTAGLPLLEKPQAKAAKQFLNDELQHTGELLALIKTAEGKPPPRAASYDLGHPTDAEEVLALLHGLERAQIAGYLDAIPRLAPGSVRAGVSTILASDAQHISILRLLQGSSPVPSAFVTGSE
jgi:hypothetical protein